MQTKIPINVQANNEQIRPAPDKYNTKYYAEAITFSLSNKDNHLWNDMITVLSANFAQFSATQTEFWCKLNYQIESNTNKGNYEAKRHKVMQTMQQTMSNRQNREWILQRLWAENKLCKELN